MNLNFLMVQKTKKGATLTLLLFLFYLINSYFKEKLVFPTNSPLSKMFTK